MREVKDTQRSLVRVSFDGRVYKLFRGKDAEERYTNEIKVLRALESRGCNYVPQLLSCDDEALEIVTTNCGQIVEKLSQGKLDQLFGELEEVYGVRHDDPFTRNVTYRQSDGRFCIIDFELAEIVGPGTAAGQAKGEEMSDAAGEGSGRHLSWSGVTHPGKVRTNNEDAFLLVACWPDHHAVLPRDGDLELGAADAILAVSDGMGGASLGEHASAVVLREIGDRLPRALQVGEAEDTAAVLTAAIAAVHAKINSHARHYRECSGTGATLSLAWFRPGTPTGALTVAHVGDSRIYRYREGELEQVTEDHSTIGRLIRSGNLSPYAARYHPLRNVLSQAIGAGIRTIYPQIEEVDCQPGDVFLLCSDGLNDGVTDGAIRKVFDALDGEGNSLAEARDELLELALKAGGKDNITIVVARVGA